MLVNLATGNVTVVLLMSGRSALNLANALVALVLNVTLNLVLIPRLGITGAALAWAVSLVYVNVAPLLQLRAGIGLRPPFGPGFVLVACASLVCFGLLGVAVRLSFGMSIASLAGFCALATLSYAGLLLRFRDLLLLPELRRMLRRRP
jgi:O-antigen/teichoic acid export membrane protein